MSRRLMLHSQSDPLMMTDILCLDGIDNTLEGHKSDTGYYWWDLSGNGNHFYRSNWSSVTTWTKNALSLQGNSSHVLIRDITLPNNTEFSVEVVAAPTAYTQGYGGYYYGWIFSNRTDEKKNYVQAVALKTPKGVDGRSFGGNFYSITDIPASLGKIGCQTITVVNGHLKCYFNGKLHDESDTTGNISLNSQWTIGEWSGAYRYIGYIYRIGINSKPFTASEVASRWRYFQERFGE